MHPRRRCASRCKRARRSRGIGCKSQTCEQREDHRARRDGADPRGKEKVIRRQHWMAVAVATAVDWQTYLALRFESAGTNKKGAGDPELSLGTSGALRCYPMTLSRGPLPVSQGSRGFGLALSRLNACEAPAWQPGPLGRPLGSTRYGVPAARSRSPVPHYHVEISSLSRSSAVFAFGRITCH